MKLRLLIVLLLIVLLPLAVLGWVGMRLVGDEREIVGHRLESILHERLADVDGAIARLLEARARELHRITELGSVDAETIRAAVRRERLVRQIFVLDAKGRLAHPRAASDLTAGERAFLERTRRIWEDKERFARPADGRAAAANGWYAWYADNDLNLIYWRRDAVGEVVGAEVDRIALTADIVAALPATDPARPSLPDGRIALCDSVGRTIYEWGAHEPRPGERPRATRSLGAPLGSWKLSYFAPAADVDEAIGRGARFFAAAGVGALALVLLGLAGFLYRESSREARLARERVTFVNQVSHELKTPLTNIRMYAELLEDELDEADGKAKGYLKVIADESRRLSRLIANVLTFARKERRKLALRPASVRVDDVVAAVVEQFRPALEAKGVRVEVLAGAGDTVLADADAVGQILGNLLSNVEKYGALGRAVRIATRQEGGQTTIVVADEGPGVPAAERERIFRPFHRLSDKVTEGVSGTGIGLAIARDLARLHGGDVRLLDAEQGAAFEVRLATPKAKERGVS